MVEADLQDRGVDIDDALLGKSWRWLRVRITGLLAVDSRLARAARADLAATP